MKANAFSSGWLVVAILSTTTIHAQDISILDMSAPDSPIRLSGTINISESLQGSDMVNSVIKGRVVALNVSNKPILCYILGLDIAGRWRQHKMRFENDCTFTETLVNPRQSMDSEVDSNSTTSVSVTQGLQPVAVAKILWVQFIDGSEYGDRNWATGILAARMYMVDKLSTLLRAYERSGPKGFEEELMAEYTNIKAGNLILTLRKIFREQGTERALRATRHFLQNAKAHLAAMSGRG